MDVVAGPARTVKAGSLIADLTNEALWYVYADGTTGASGTAGLYAVNRVPVFAEPLALRSANTTRGRASPQSGEPASNLVKGPLNGAAGQERAVAVVNTSVSFVTAVLLTELMVNTVNTGFLSVGKGDFVWNPSAPFSSTNWYANGQIVATTVATRVDASGQVKIRAGGPGTSDVLVDLVGVWFVP